MLFESFCVFAGAGVDLDALAFLDEEGHADLDAGFDGGVLHGVGGGVASEAGLGVGDDGLDERRQLAGQRGLGVGLDGDLNILAVLEELRGVDDLLGDVDLLVGLGVHEDMHVAFLVEVGVGTTLDADDVDLGAAGEGVLEHAAGLHVAHLGAHEGGALAGFHVEELNDGVDVVVEIDAKSVLDVGGCCHCNYCLIV